MTKKDYIKFADMLKKHLLSADDRTKNKAYEKIGIAEVEEIDSIIKDTAHIFAMDNPLFDRDRFLKACGL